MKYTIDYDSIYSSVQEISPSQEKYKTEVYNSLGEAKKKLIEHLIDQRDAYNEAVRRVRRLTKDEVRS